MPKGVEHERLTVPAGLSGFVIPSLMPKGVEHIRNSEPEELTQSVIPSLMPKGVEHSEFRDLYETLDCDSFVDAERR